MRGHSFLRAGLMLVLLPTLLFVQTPVPVHSAATATYTFTGTVYVIEGTAQELAGVTLTLYTSSRPDALGTARATAVSSNHGTYSLS